MPCCVLPVHLCCGTTPPVVLCIPVYVVYAVVLWCLRVVLRCPLCALLDAPWAPGLVQRCVYGVVSSLLPL